MTVADTHLNRNGVAHGGLLCTLADWAMATEVLARISDGQSTATIDITTKFHRPASLGERLVTRVQVTRHSRSLMCLECEILNSRAKVISKSYATFMIFAKDTRKIQHDQNSECEDCK
ncbi:PaaI family thioesterase [Marinobacter daepoensis]|uniref:PaaI family thioesterase n=1 Tax=Marinobacter daepoensis TaxID=262077 RepID=A0ABS3BE72_9GAMM|nr:PaaI family thioesterase [Marinobacter daepoensis]MBY6079580.1 PaaI family thioesterase [Marinobacter daepoensis]